MRALLVLLGLVGGLARAEVPSDRGELSLGLVSSSYLSFIRATPGRYAASLAYQRGLGGAWEGVHLGGGLRLSTPGDARGLPLELFARVSLEARLGPWRPAVGPEVGYSGWTRLSDAGVDPSGLFEREQGRVGPLYLAIQVAPLRFQWERWSLSAFELQVGASVPPLGGASRFQLGFLSVGRSL